MPNTLRLRRGTTTPVATSFVDGEPAWDSTNSRLFIKNTAGSMVQIGDAVLSASNGFTGANTYYNATGQTFGTATAANDGIVLQGRAGGTSSFRSTLVPGTLTASRTLTLPDVSGTVVTTGDTGSVSNAMLATITTAGKVSGAAITSGTISGSTAINTAGGIQTSGTLTGFVNTNSGTSSTPPIQISAASVLTSSALEGSVEFAGNYYYATPLSASGRGCIPVQNTFRLTADGTAIGPAAADFFGATSAINLAASSVYNIEILAYLLKNTAGTLTWALASSSAPTLVTAMHWAGPVTGIASGTPTTLYTGARNSTSATFGATGSITAGAFMAYQFKINVITNLATTFKLQVTSSAGTVTPTAGSFYTVNRISTTTGSFA